VKRNQRYASIRETVCVPAARMTALPWDIKHIVADGDIFMTVRVDHFQFGDSRVSVPCMGIFELSLLLDAYRDGDTDRIPALIDACAAYPSTP